VFHCEQRCRCGGAIDDDSVSHDDDDDDIVDRTSLELAAMPLLIDADIVKKLRPVLSQDFRGTNGGTNAI
jgi:hypothetical protein